MKKNLGLTDRIIRVIIAAVITFLFFNGNIPHVWWGWVLLAVGAVLLLTALFNFCPIYATFRLSSAKKDS